MPEHHAGPGWTYRLRILLVALVITAVMLNPGQATIRAQDGGIRVQFEGTVEAVKEDTIAVDAIVVNISKIVPDNPPKVGMVVKVEGLLTADNRVMATKVTVLKTPAPDEKSAFAFASVVDSFNGSVMVVNGLTVDSQQGGRRKGYCRRRYCQTPGTVWCCLQGGANRY